MSDPCVECSARAAGARTPNWRRLCVPRSVLLGRRREEAAPRARREKRRAREKRRGLPPWVLLAEVEEEAELAVAEGARLCDALDLCAQLRRDELVAKLLQTRRRDTA